MAAGKNKLLRWARLYAGAYDVSGDAKGFGSADNSFGEVDMTGWSESVNNFLCDDRRVVGIHGFTAHMNDAALRTATSIQANPASAAVTMAFGAGAAPAAGDVAYLLPPLQIQDMVSFDGGAAIFSADFICDASQMASSYYDNPMGVVLYPLTAISTSADGDSVDGVAAGSTGFAANLHVTTATGGTVTSEQITGSGEVLQYRRFTAAESMDEWTFLVEDSATGDFTGEETTLAVFTAVTASAVTVFASLAVNY